MIIYIIIIVVLVWSLFHQNSRISRIEKILEGSDVKKIKATSTQASSTAQTAPLVVSASAMAASMPSSKKSNVSSEEVSGRFLGRLGVAAVLIGVAFFLKYAFDNNWIGPAGRVMIGIVAGLGFLGVGQYLRKKYLTYSDLLMGGGIAILYLSIFSAHSFYNLINSFTAGVFMFVVTALALAISIVNATEVLALIGVIGGFATPFLMGSHENNMLGLFGYLTVLNIGILGISFFKKWPRQIVAAFFGTGINFLAWYSVYYDSTVLSPVMFFLFISFLIFLVASIVRVVIEKGKADQITYFILGANAFCFAFIGYFLLNPQYHSVLGFAAVLMAIIYVIVAVLANKYNPEDLALNIFLPGIAVVFLSLAVPLQFSGPWIAVAWLVESCFLYVIASTINNRGFQLMGIIVYALGCLDFLFWFSQNQSEKYLKEFVPIANTAFIVMALGIAAAYFIAFMYKKYGSSTTEIQKRGIMAFVVIANIITIYAFTVQIDGHYKARLLNVDDRFNITQQQNGVYNTGYGNSEDRQAAYQLYYEETGSIKNQSNTAVSILWVIYAAILTGIGFAYRLAGVRRLGLILFVFTAVKVVVDVWSLGQLYRIISFTVFGLIALIASFAYAKYKDRLKDIV